MVKPPCHAMTRIFCAAFGVLCGAFTRVNAQRPDVAVDHRGPAVITVEPGTRVTLVWRLNNNATVPRVAQGELVLPPGWRLVIADSAVRIPARESEIKLLHIAIPTDVRADTFVVRYVVTVSSATRGAVVSQDSVRVVVPERRIFTALPSDVPRFVLAGEKYVSRFAVRNIGNAPVTLRLRASATERFPVQLDSAVIHLASGEERTVAATVTTDARLNRGLIHRVQLDARAVNDTASVVGVSTVEIVPRHVSTGPRYRLVPAQLALRRGGGDQSVTPELRGAGFITKSRELAVDFLARAPSPGGSFLGQQDVYWLNLHSSRYELGLGDQYRASRVNATQYASFGADAALTLGAVKVGGFTQRDRRSFGFSREQQHGGTIDVGLFKDALVGVGFLTRSGIDAGNIWSARGLLPLLPGAAMDWELGRGRNGRSVGNAYSVDVGGALAGLSYSLRRQAADTGFLGFWRGTSYSDAGVTVGPFRKLRFVSSLSEVGTQKWSLPGSRDARQRIFESGVDYASIIGTTYRNNRQTGSGSGPVAGALRHGEAIGFFLGVPTAIGGFRGEIQHGYSISNAAPKDRSPYRRWSLSGSVRAAQQIFGAGIERTIGTPEYAFTAQDQTTAMVNAGIRIVRGSQLNVGLRTTRYGGPQSRTFSTLDIGLGQQLPSGHRIGWQGRSLASTFGPTDPVRRQSMQQLEYVIPLGVPVGASGESGAVVVQLVDDHGRPLGGVLTRLGAQARITDLQGRATFANLEAGTHYLEVDRGKLGRGQVVTPANPLVVIIKANETRRVELHVVGSASIRGSVRNLQYRSLGPDKPDTLVDVGALRNIALALGNSGDTARALTDAEGKFTFSDLHPGRWVLRVVGGDLPPNRLLEPQRMEFNLRPGDTSDVVLNAVPTQRDVQFVAEAEVPVARAGEAPPGAAPGARRYYTVKKGDRLTQIARVMYGDASQWQKIWIANRDQLPTPSALRAGQRLAIPDLSAPTTGARRTYTVSKGDASLLFIARVMYDDPALWPKIWLANLDQVPDPRRLRPGVRLRIPEQAPLTADEIAARDAYLARRKP